MMTRISAKLRQGENFISFWCPGCEDFHIIKSSGEGAWSVSAVESDQPSFQPSVLVTSGHYAKGGAPGGCWCDMEARTGMKPGFKCGICHSFVTAGRIQFLSDCTHALAGQTVDLPDFPEDQA